MDENAGVAVQEQAADSAGRAVPVMRRRTWAARLVIAGLVIGALFWAVSAEALRTSSGISSWGGGSVGESFHIGEMGMIDRDLTVLWFRPRIVGDAAVQVRVCRRGADHRGGAIGTIQGDAELQQLCPELEPLRRGTRLATDVPDGTSLDYVLISLVPKNTAPVAYCGLDVVYRSGNRFGIDGGAGGMYTVIYPDGRSPEEPDELC